MTETAGCVTALYDCRSKQEYIYRTNRIREISGGSALLANVYRNFFERAENKGIRINTDWKNGQKFSIEKFIESGADGEVIYEGGGNLYMIFRSRDIYIKANRVFSRMLLDKTYSVSLVASCVDTTDNFLDDRKRLYEENSRIKSTGNVSLPCNVLPITQVDGVTYLPIAEKKNEKSLSAESKLKLKAFDELSDKSEIYLDKLTPDKGTESLIAVIYADGNAMGKKVKNCTEGKNGYSECVDALRELSLRTNNSFVDRPIAAIEKMLAEKAGDGTHKYRKVIAGGDEITLICNARVAMDIAVTYFKTLEEENKNLSEKEKDKACYACMGIAIAHSHAPFSDVYRIAEQCCESGKKKAREKDSKVNYIDFHFCRAGITGDLDTVRETQEKDLTARPYKFSAEFQHFADTGEKLKKIGRANIKELAAAIIKGDSYYQFESERIKSRYPDLGLDSSDEEQKKLIFDIANVYDLWFAGEEEAE